MLKIQGSIPSRPQKAPISRSFFCFYTLPFFTKATLLLSSTPTFSYPQTLPYKRYKNHKPQYYWDLSSCLLTFVPMKVKLHERKNCRILSFNYLVFRNQPDKFIPPTL